MMRRLATGEMFRMAFNHIPDQGKLGGNARGNREELARLFAEEKELWIGLIREKYAKDEMPVFNHANAEVTVIFEQARRRDEPNVAASYKAFWDALQSDKIEMLTDDDIEHLTVEPMHLTVSGQDGPQTIIELEELAGIKAEEFEEDPPPATRGGIKDEPQTNMDERVIEDPDLLGLLDSWEEAESAWQEKGKPAQKARKQAKTNVEEHLTPELVAPGTTIRVGKYQISAASTQAADVAFTRKAKTKYTIKSAEED